jgi:hypothetical protein
MLMAALDFYLEAGEALSETNGFSLSSEKLLKFAVMFHSKDLKNVFHF